MNFKITNIEYYTSSDSATIDNVLGDYGSSLQEIESTLKSHIFVHQNINKGFQIELSKQIAKHLEDLFRTKPQNFIYRNKSYSKDVNFKTDVAIEHKENKKAIFIEIEFRPNECKDIVKFQIGYKYNNLALGILIVAKNRENINLGYTTMPDFTLCKKIISALRPECPILLIGFDGCKLD